MTAIVHIGDALTVLRTLPAESVHCCVTSPPYWGLRDYGVAGQLGLEPTLAEYLQGLVAVFEEVRRVLRPDGTCWVNMGDSYASSSLSNRGRGKATPRRNGHGKLQSTREASNPCRLPPPAGMKPKDMLGQPWRLAFALQDAGWYLRSEIIWHKPSPMPEAVRDRPTRSHEQLFLLTKRARYFYDAAAIMEPVAGTANPRRAAFDAMRAMNRRRSTKADPTQSAAPLPPKEAGRGEQRLRQSLAMGRGAGWREAPGMLVERRNCRSVWRIASAPFKGAHFATYPPALVRPCILAGCPLGGTVLDPFTGSGTTGVVAVQHGRHFVGIELNPEYAEMARRRIDAADPIGYQLAIEGIA